MRTVCDVREDVCSEIRQMCAPTTLLSVFRSAFHVHSNVTHFTDVITYPTYCFVTRVQCQKNFPAVLIDGAID